MALWQATKKWMDWGNDPRNRDRMQKPSESGAIDEAAACLPFFLHADLYPQLGMSEVRQ
jgi:hypothetical protein